MNKDLSLSNGRKFYLSTIDIKTLMVGKTIKTNGGTILVDTSTKQKYTNPAIATLCDFIIERGFGNTIFEIEGTSSKGHDFINRGTCAETLINCIVDILSNSTIEHLYVKANANGVDLDITSLPYNVRKQLGLTLDKGLVEIKYANSNTKANSCKSSVDSVLLLTPNGFSVVKRKDLIIDKKTHKIFASSESNGRKCNTLNALVGF
jgi:hypothetical protein